MAAKPFFPRTNVAALLVLLMGALTGFSCGASNITQTQGSASSSNSELEGPIEELLPTTGTPEQLRIYGVTVNIQGVPIELGSDVLLSPLDLAPTQFVEVEFSGGSASEIEVEEAKAEGTLLDLNSAPANNTNIPVNRNTRTINATFTVLGAGVLCDNSFTQVQVNGQVGSCALLAQLNGMVVEVEGLVVDNFTRSLSDLGATVAPRDVILAREVKRD